MFQYLALTDGTTVIDLSDAINYALVSYAPVIAPLRDNELGGGDGPYADTTEQITIQAIGCSAAEAYAAAKAVNDLLDQARRWWKGEGVTAVRLLIQAQESALDPLSVIIKGRAPGSPPNMALPATWNAQAQRYVIQGITIQFVRRARLLGATESASVAAAAVPTVMTATFATTHNQLSPLKVDFTGAPGGAGSTVIIAVTPNNGQTIIEAESGSLGPDTTSVNDSANSARGNNIARYTAPAIPIATELVTLTISGLSASARRFVVIMAVRKNTAADSFDLSCSFRKVNGATAVVMTTTETRRISDSNVNPQLLIFDPASTRDQPNSLVINITPVSTVAGRTFDVDYVAIIQVDDNASTILTAVWPSLGANDTIEVDPTVLEPTPRVQVVNGGVNFPMTYLGDPAAFGVRGSVVQCTIYATGGAATPTRWRMYNSAGAAVAQLALSLSRQKAYLIPE